MEVRKLAGLNEIENHKMIWNFKFWNKKTKKNRQTFKMSTNIKGEEEQINNISSEPGDR